MILSYVIIFLIGSAALLIISGKPADSLSVTIPALLLVSAVTTVYRKRLSLKNTSAFVPLIYGILLSAVNIIFEARVCDPTVGSDFSVSVLLFNQIYTAAVGAVLSAVLLMIFHANDKKSAALKGTAA